MQFPLRLRTALLATAALCPCCTDGAIAPQRAEETSTTPSTWVSEERVITTSLLNRQEQLSTATPTNIRKEFAHGELQWEPLLFALDDFFFVDHARRRCGEQFGDSVANQTTPTPKCNIRMDVHIVRDNEACTIEAVDVRKIETEDKSLFCPDYAKCLAEARLGATVPCPPTATFPGERSGVSLWLQALHQPKLFDPAFVDRLIDTHIQAKSGGPPVQPESPQEAYMIRMGDRYLEYLKWHRTTLE